MDFIEQGKNSHNNANINSFNYNYEYSIFNTKNKRNMQNVSISCTKFGTCERNDGNLLKVGFQPKSKIIATKITNIIEGNTVSVNPFLNSGVIGFLKGSKTYVCADGFNECINSCCYEGLCRYSQNYCERIWSQNTKMAYAPAVVFFIAIVAYWITFIILGIMYSKKTTSVVVQTAKAIKRKKTRENGDIYGSNKVESSENRVSEEKIENFNDPFNQDKNDFSNSSQNNYNSNDGFNYKDYDESKMKKNVNIDKFNKHEDTNKNMNSTNFNSNQFKSGIKNFEMHNVNGDYNSMMTNIKLIKPLDSIEDIKQYNDQKNKSNINEIKNVKMNYKIEDLNSQSNENENAINKKTMNNINENHTQPISHNKIINAKIDKLPKHKEEIEIVEEVNNSPENGQN